MKRLETTILTSDRAGIRALALSYFSFIFFTSLSI